MESTVDRRWFLVLLVAVVGISAGVWFGRGVTPPANPSGAAAPSWSADASTTTSVTDLVVHVSGWVQTPGLVRVPSGSRVGDAVAAAGGIRPEANLAGLNLARLLADGEQVVVPGPAGKPVVAGLEPEAAGDGLVHLNTAAAADLEALPGVGPVLAERIVAHRDEMGPFEAVEGLLEVSGIGEAKLASLRDLVAVP